MPDNIKLNLQYVDVIYEMTDGRSNIEISTSTQQQANATMASTSRPVMESAAVQERSVMQNASAFSDNMPQQESFSIDWYEVIKILLLAALFIVLAPKPKHKVISQSEADVPQPKHKKEKCREVKTVDASEQNLDVDKICKTADDINNILKGHDDFKKDFKSNLLKYLFWDNMGERKIFSIIICGESGIGKTEFAKIVSDKMFPSEELIKINFGNYSTDGVLNS
jgi:ATPases with chaperone activity, ATP-binding subunit